MAHVYTSHNSTSPPTANPLSDQYRFIIRMVDVYPARPRAAAAARLAAFKRDGFTVFEGVLAPLDGGGAAAIAPVHTSALIGNNSRFNSQTIVCE